MEPIAIRASSLSDLFDCPARWEAKHVRGLRLPSGPKAILGKAVHASTAVYDKARIDGVSITADDAAGAAVDTIQHPVEDVDWKADEGLTPTTAENVALGLHALYCERIAPRQRYLGVEVLCKNLLIADIGIVLTGTTDRVRVDDFGRLGIADLKTSGNAVATDGTVRTQGHGAQLAVYEILAGHALGRTMTAPAVIVGLQTAKTPRGMRVGLGEVPSAMEALVGTDEYPGMLTQASRIVHSGLFFGNPRSQICNRKYCPAWGVCHYR